MAFRARWRPTSATWTRPRCPSRRTESSTWGGAVSYGIPISETDTVNLGFRFEHTESDAFTRSAVRPRTSCIVNEFGDAPTASSSASAGRVTRATTSSILRAGCCRCAGRRGGAAHRRPVLLQGELPGAVVCAGLRRFRADAARRRRLCRRLLQQVAAVLQGVLRRRRWVGARLRNGVPGTARHLWEHAWAASARSSATPSCSIRS